MDSGLHKSEGSSRGIECISESLSLHEKPYQETAIDKTYWSVFTPQNALSDTGNSITFSIPQCEDNLDLNESYYKLSVKVTKNDGKELDNFTAPDNSGHGNSVGPINLAGSSFFSNIHIRLGEELISDSYGTYAFLSFFQVIFNYTKAARDSLLSLAGYCEEKTFAKSADSTASSSSFKTLATATSNSKIVTYVAPIFHGLFNQSRYIPALTSLQIEFQKSPAAFALTSNASAPEFKYQIVALEVFIKKVALRASVKLRQEQQLLKSPAQYNFRSAGVKPFFIPKGAKSASFENIFPGNVIPNLAIVAFLPQSKYRGDYSSPFEFKDHGLTSLRITANGEVFPSPGGYNPDYATDSKKPDWTHPYLSLYFNQLKLNQERICNYSEFKNGFVMYTFDFGTESPLAHDHIVMKKIASGARMDITFASNSSNDALVALLYTESQACLEIDGNRRISRDYYL